ncbi:MAG TPA: hypothetical protein VK750_01635 [Cytophagaceae bacterium]|jgi:hypothetical protein|nr:hypothetical protein [Cytophagaceae bacterium]
MENIAKIVSEKTGITEAQAQVAIDTIVSVLKDKLPAGIGAQVESFVKGSGSSDALGGITGGISDTLGNMFK